MSEDAELLIAYARRGDVDALSALVVRHSPWMSALLRGMLPDADVADALQETWLKVIRSAGRFRGEGLKSYLGVAARSTAIDLLRKRGRLVSLDAEPAEGDGPVPDPVDPAPTPSEAFASRATKEEILFAVRALAEGPRQVLLLRLEAGMPFREIAEELGVPLGTALTWMRAATLKLREFLGERDERESA